MSNEAKNEEPLVSRGERVSQIAQSIHNLLASTGMPREEAEGAVMHALAIMIGRNTPCSAVDEQIEGACKTLATLIELEHILSHTEDLKSTASKVEAAE